MALLELKDVHTYYGAVHALRGVSLKVEEGEIVTLIGSNGAGKTTTLRTISGTMSGGEQQMLAIGRALMAQPKVLLLDEPSMGLAPILVEQIFNIIKEINSRGTAVLLVEQNAMMALGIANRGYILQIGEVTLEDDCKKLALNPKVKEAYLGV